jgi:cell division protein FtsB
MLFEASATRFLRIALIGLLLLGALGVIGLHIARSDRGERLARLDRTEARLGGEVARLRRVNATLMEDLELMETSTIGWQEAARREHGMLLPGEVVIRFPAE